MAAKKEVAEKKLLRVLCLHGYRQDEQIFREKTGALRKILKSHIEFTYAEALHLVPPLQVTEDNGSKEVEDCGSNARGWWFSHTGDNYLPLETTDYDKGFQQSLDYINSIFESKGPFDGVLGFSQGGSFLSILCNPSIHQRYEKIKFSFAIIVSGFKSKQTTHGCYYDLDNKVEIPTLHVIGSTDRVIPKEMSVALCEYFGDFKQYIHNGGHYVPANSEAKNVFTGFLNEVKNKKTQLN